MVPSFFERLLFRIATYWLWYLLVWRLLRSSGVTIRLVKSGSLSSHPIASLKKEDTPILRGYQIFHNYVRPHMALNGKTPAEVCGIEIKGKDKWLTLIQNASVNE